MKCDCNCCDHRATVNVENITAAAALEVIEHLARQRRDEDGQGDATQHHCS